MESAQQSLNTDHSPDATMVISRAKDFNISFDEAFITALPDSKEYATAVEALQVAQRERSYDLEIRGCHKRGTSSEELAPLLRPHLPRGPATTTPAHAGVPSGGAPLASSAVPTDHWVLGAGHAWLAEPLPAYHPWEMTPPLPMSPVLRTSPLLW